MNRFEAETDTAFAAIYSPNLYDPDGNPTCNLVLSMHDTKPQQLSWWHDTTPLMSTPHDFTRFDIPAKLLPYAQTFAAGKMPPFAFADAVEELLPDAPKELLAFLREPSDWVDTSK